MRVKTEKTYHFRERYYYDFGMCKSWAQLDTRQDASYYGTWACPIKREFLSFAEGDEKHITFDTDEEFIKEINEWFDWATKGGWEPSIDPGLSKENIKAWEKLGFKYHENGTITRPMEEIATSE